MKSEMCTIKEAVETFCDKRLRVYQGDNHQIERDVNAARSAIEDHAGRWFLEVLQNADDAQASTVVVRSDNNRVLYIADNGSGLKAHAVEALCGTNYSVKSAGAIGRKGVGFKSVYTVSKNPIVLTRQGGVEFCEQKCREWMQKRGLNTDQVPYQWIPFYLSWENALERFPFLSTLGDNVSTVIILPLEQEEPPEWRDIVEWSSICLLAFPHLRQVQTPSFKVHLKTGGSFHILEDSRLGTETRWKLRREIRKVPDALLEKTDYAHRRFIAQEGISLIVACQVDEDDAPMAIDTNPQVHVFYPTQHPAPIPMFLHAEFLVKSDRTAVLRFEDYELNRWIAHELAKVVVDFVRDSYSPQKPERFITLLSPSHGEGDDPISGEIWKVIQSTAHENLRLPDVSGELKLRLDEARYVRVSADIELARKILVRTSLGNCLVHRALDAPGLTRKALEALGCKGIDDDEFIEIIRRELLRTSDFRDLLSDCLDWLSLWLEKREKNWGAFQEDKKKVRSLPLIPVNNQLHSSGELEGKVITWKKQDVSFELPEWLPLTFIDDWFAECLREHPRWQKVFEILQIHEPKENVFLQAVGSAMRDYWQCPDSNPERFLRFIIQAKLHECGSSCENLGHCPVPVRRKGTNEIEWEKADNSYFTAAWSTEYSNLENYFGADEEVRWLICPEELKAVLDIEVPDEELVDVMTWLNVWSYPRILRLGEVKDVHSNELSRHSKEWAALVRNSIDWGTELVSVEVVDVHGLRADKTPQQLLCLLSLLHRQWGYYYTHRYSQVQVQVQVSRRSRLEHTTVTSLWLHRVMKEIPLVHHLGNTLPLGKCWLPDRETKKKLGELLPIVPIRELAQDSELDEFQQWLVENFKVRTDIKQLSKDEWVTILSRWIPQLAPDKGVQVAKERYKRVYEWYDALVEWARSQDREPQDGCLADCPILCEKAGLCQYVDSSEERYIDDDSEIAQLFGDDVWICRPKAGSRSELSRLFGIPLISSRITKMLREESTSCAGMSGDAKQVIEWVKPYLYAFRAYSLHSNEKAILNVRQRLRDLQIVRSDIISVRLCLNGTFTRDVEYQHYYDADKNLLYLVEADETVLAAGLAEVLGTKNEADLYENLIRCYPDAEAARRKLRSKGLTDGDIDRKDEFLDAHCLEPPVESAPEPTPAIPAGSAPATYVPQASETTPVSQPDTAGTISGGEYQDTVELPLYTDVQSITYTARIDTEITANAEKSAGEQGALVDPSATPYEIKTAPPLASTTEPTSQASGSGRASTAPYIDDIERCALELVKRALKEYGYTRIEERHHYNPGYDIEAVDPQGVKVHIEVKGHQGAAKQVILTNREYQEYVNQEVYRWELWNVERLRLSNVSKPTITVFTRIPEAALIADQFKVDLTKCEAKLIQFPRSDS